MPYVSERLKILGQANPSSGSLTDVYTVPSGKDASVSSIVVSNRTTGSGYFSVSVAVSGSADDPKQYLYYEIPTPGSETFIATVGVSLSTFDVVRVRSTGNMSFNVFGTEVQY